MLIQVTQSQGYTFSAPGSCDAIGLPQTTPVSTVASKSVDDIQPAEAMESTLLKNCLQLLV